MIDPLIPLETAPTLSSRVLRQFAGLWILFFGALALWQGWGRENPRSAWILAGIGLVVGLAGLISPPLIRPVFKGALAIARPISWVVSNLLLTLFFFIVFVPMGLLFRLVGRDSLRLRRPAGRETYLLPKPPPAGVRSYFRQS